MKNLLPLALAAILSVAIIGCGDSSDASRKKNEEAQSSAEKAGMEFLASVSNEDFETADKLVFLDGKESAALWTAIKQQIILGKEAERDSKTPTDVFHMFDIRVDTNCVCPSMENNIRFKDEGERRALAAEHGATDVRIVVLLLTPHSGAVADNSSQYRHLSMVTICKDRQWKVVPNGMDAIGIASVERLRELQACRKSRRESDPHEQALFQRPPSSPNAIDFDSAPEPPEQIRERICASELLSKKVGVNGELPEYPNFMESSAAYFRCHEKE